MQRVNLLTDDLRPKRDPFAFRDLLTLWGGLLFVLLAISGYTSFALIDLNEKNVEVVQHLREIQAANAALRAEAERKPEPALAASVAKLKRLREEQQLIAALLKDVATSDGFSVRLTDLARYKLDGLWLSEVAFADGGSSVRLRGFSEAARHVPEFLAALSAGDGFDGYTFEGFELRDEEDSELLSFELAGPTPAMEPVALTGAASRRSPAP